MNSKNIVTLFAVTTILSGLGACQSVASNNIKNNASPQSNKVEKREVKSTIPLLIHSDRPYVELTIEAQNGEKKIGRFLVDTGGGAFIVTQAFADEIGWLLGAEMNEGEGKFNVVRKASPVYFDTTALALNTSRIIAVANDTYMSKSAGLQVDGMLPGHVLAKYHAIFDYPAKTLTLAPPNSVTPRGEIFPMPVHPRSGFPRTELEIDGKRYGFLIDTGASFTIVSENLMKALGEKNPAWERHAGAHGGAKTLGGQTLETMYIPQATWGTFTLIHLGVTSQPSGTYEKWMSGMMKAPILGALSTNAMKRFRVELDFANEKLYLSEPGKP